MSGAVSETLAKIESELGSFWSAPDTSSGSAVAKVRASTMNYAVATVSDDLERIRKETQELAETRAGRVFLLTVDARSAPWEVESNVSATCTKQGDDVICHDRIELVFGAMAAARAGSVLSALALSEVPVVAEIGRGAPAALANELLKIADRVVVDSAHTPLTRIAELTGRTRAKIADRAMVRAFSWRELVARFFDDRVAAARAISSLTVGRTPGGEQEPAALFIGWLASRLNWSIESRTHAVSPEKLPIEIAVVDDPRTDVEKGVLTSVEIHAKLNGEELIARCARTADPAILAWSLEGAKQESHRHPLGFHDETWVLLKALDVTVGDSVVREATFAGADWSAM